MKTQIYLRLRYDDINMAEIKTIHHFSNVIDSSVKQANTAVFSIAIVIYIFSSNLDSIISLSSSMPNTPPPSYIKFRSFM